MLSSSIHSVPGLVGRGNGLRYSARLAGSLHAMAFKDLFTGPTQLCAVLLQAPLNGHIIIQLFSAKAGSIARTSLLLLWCSEMATLRRCKR
jgi:hypothetical protein